MYGGEGIAGVAKSSWKTCVSVQGEAESTSFVGGWLTASLYRKSWRSSQSSSSDMFPSSDIEAAKEGFF